MNSQQKSPCYAHQTFSYLSLLFQLETVSVESQEKSPLMKNPLFQEETVVWIFELAEQVHAKQRTKHLSIHLLDKTLSNLIVNVSDYQLLACLCLALAQKFEEERNLTYSDIEKLTNYHYKREQIAIHELAILKSLNWKIDSPLACDFLASFSNFLIEENTEFHEQLAQRLDFCLSEQAFAQFRPSIIAMACLLEFFIDCQFQEGVDAALIFINQWGNSLKYEDIKACCEILQGFFGKIDEEKLKTPNNEEEKNFEVSTAESKYEKFEEEN